MTKQKLFCRSGSAALSRSLAAVVSCILSFASLGAADRVDATQPNRITAGAAYTASNSSSGNEVFAYKRSRSGQLAFVQAFPTGGTGNDDPAALGNQGGVILSQDGSWLLVVNPGSNDVSVFRVAQNSGLSLTDTEPSNGELPVSVTMHGNLVYVLNGGGDGNISGYTIDATGNLTPLAGSVQPLSGMTLPAPAQIQFTPAGDSLVVTEKNTNLIDTYAVDGSGVAGAPVINASAGETPFGFDFSQQGFLIVSEAFGGLPDIGAVSNYLLNGDGELEVVDASEPTHETAPCWIVTTESGRFTYTTNTGSGTITGFRIDRSGQLIALDSDGITAETGLDSLPTDEALSDGSRFLYALNSGTHEIIGFRVNQFDGSLEPVSSVGGVPPFAFGLVAR